MNKANGIVHSLNHNQEARLVSLPNGNEKKRSQQISRIRPLFPHHHLLWMQALPHISVFLPLFALRSSSCPSSSSSSSMSSSSSSPAPSPVAPLPARTSKGDVWTKCTRSFSVSPDCLSANKWQAEFQLGATVYGPRTMARVDCSSSSSLSPLSFEEAKATFMQALRVFQPEGQLARSQLRFVRGNRRSSQFRHFCHLLFPFFLSLSCLFLFSPSDMNHGQCSRPICK